MASAPGSGRMPHSVRPADRRPIAAPARARARCLASNSGSSQSRSIVATHGATSRGVGTAGWTAVYRSGIVKHEPGVAQGLGQGARGRWPAPGCRWPSPRSPPGPATRARATASAPPGSPGRSRAGRACWPSGSGSSGPIGPPAARPGCRPSRAPRRPGAGCPAAAGPAPARSGRRPSTPFSGCGLTNVT